MKRSAVPFAVALLLVATVLPAFAQAPPAGMKMYAFSSGPLTIAKSALHRGWWVRAEGTVLDDPRRIKVAKLHVIGKDTASFRQSAIAKGFGCVCVSPFQIQPHI